MVDSLVEQCGRVDILFTAAGVGVHKKIMDLSDSVIKAVDAYYFLQCFRGSHALARWKDRAGSDQDGPSIRVLEQGRLARTDRRAAGLLACAVGARASASGARDMPLPSVQHGWVSYTGHACTSGLVGSARMSMAFRAN